MAAALYAIEMPLTGWWAGLIRRGAASGWRRWSAAGSPPMARRSSLTGAAKVGEITGLLKRERSRLDRAEAKADNPLPPETFSSSIT